MREAIQSWWIVLNFHPDDVKIKEKISLLRKKAMAKADGHFKKGVDFYRNGRVRDARREFLLTLAYDQNHVLALDYLKTKLQRPVFRSYKVQSGDTVRKVAAKEFNDPRKYFLIMAFNGVDSSRELVAGTVLQIPLLGTDFLGKKNADKYMDHYAFKQTAPARAKKKRNPTISQKNNPQETTRVTQEKKGAATRDLANYQQARKFLE